MFNDKVFISVKIYSTSVGFI